MAKIENIMLSVGENRTFMHCQWKYNMVLSIWRTVQQFLWQLNMHFPHDEAVIPYTQIASNRFKNKQTNTQVVNPNVNYGL